MTSQFGEKLYPTEVFLKAPEGGLTIDSVALLNQIRSIDKGRLVKRLGVIKTQTMQKIEDALRISLEL
ncbi:MAG TPA: type II toxin-antitoxin system PemK/MazF family toxin [Blastocatellia bacterium]|nr:type II toxin-antitoxin system PemK/MazF family toxin [Blastocatellia bacterium]